MRVLPHSVAIFACLPACLALVMACGPCGVELRAQGLDYPRGSVAPLHPSLPLNQIVPARLSPWFNIADGSWNWGEGFTSAVGGGDEGGVLGWPTSFPDRNDSVITPEGAQRWRDPNNAQYALNVRMSTGHLWPAGQADPRHEAGYTLWAPRVVVEAGPITKPIVLVVGIHATQPDDGVAPGFSKPWPYVASGANLGLIAPDFPANGAAIVDEALNDLSANYYLVVGYAMRPTTGRPYHWSIQRAVEFVHFAKDLLQGLPTPRTVAAVVVAGNSHGTGVAMLAPTLYPEVFHAGVGFAHPPDFTGAIAMQEFHRWIAAHFGYPGEGAASIYDVLGIGFLGRHAQAFGEGLSVPARFRSQQLVASSCLQRPLYLIVGDEDPTDTGEDWLGLLGVQNFEPVGTIPIPNAPPSAQFYYSRADKQCHESFDPNNASLSGSYYTPDQDPRQSGVLPHSTTTPALKFMIPKALDAAAHSAQPVAAPLGGVVNLNPFSGAFWAHRPADHPVSGTRPGLLQDQSSLSNPTLRWPRAGAGTRLGQGEGLRIATPPGGPKSVYVGSADGVVTRFVVGAAQTPEADQLVQAAQSPDLGYGAWALDVGDVGGSVRVAVAVEGRLCLLDALDLHVVQSVALSGPSLFRPLRLQIADLDGAAGGEILFSTFGGVLAAYSAALTPLASLHEPGIVDFLAAPQLASAFAGMGLGSLPCPIYIASVRGHIFCVELAGGMPPGPRLLAASAGETGSVQDLELVTWSGNPRIMATYTEQAGAIDLFLNRVFDPLYLDRVGQIGSDPGGQPLPDEWILPPGGVGLEAGSSGGTSVYVIQRGDLLSVFTAGGLLLGKKDVGKFAPARGVVALEVGELAGGASSSEIVVATNAGRVVWFRMSELTAPGDDLTMQAPFQLVPGTSSGFERSNRALAATWAMTYAENKLQLVDQAGMQFAVDPATGVSEWKRDFRLAGPHRALVHVGAVIDKVAPCFTDVVDGEARWNVLKVARTGAQPPKPTQLPYLSQIRGGYLLGSNGADKIIVGNETRYFWWGADRGSADIPYAHDIVLGGRITNQVLETAWDSTEQGWSSRLRLRNNMSGPGQSEHGDLQSLRLADVRGNGQHDLVLGTAGGRVIVVQGDFAISAGILAEGPDFGWGGTALAVGSLDEDPLVNPQPEIVFGTLYSPQRMGNPHLGDLQSTLNILRWDDDPSEPKLERIDSRAFASNDPSYPIVGICGLAIANVFGSSRNEIVVATTDGYFMVLEVSGGPSAYNLAVAYKKGFAGALGAHNAIHVGDHAINGTLQPGSDGKKEIYVAGSFGLRRFDVTDEGG